MEVVSTTTARATRPANIHAAGWRRQAKRPLALALRTEGASLLSEIDDYEKPLRPLRVPEHVDRYQAIDNFIEQFRKFTDIFSDPASWRTKGHLIVVTGDSGYGKTSLRQRCAFWMLSEYTHTHCEIVVVDLSDEYWKADTIDARLLRTRDWILADMAGRLDQKDIERIANIKDMMDSYRALGLALRTRGAAAGTPKPIVLVVLLPGYPQPEELTRYYGLTREGMVFIAEIFEKGAIESITEKIETRHEMFRRDSIAAHVLQLGVLKPGDDELLAMCLQSDLQNCPRLTNSQVAAYLNRLIKGRKIGMAQLMKLLTGALQYAITEQANEVTLDHIARYYENAFYRPA